MADMPATKKDVDAWIGRRLAEIRARYGWSADEMGALCHVSRDHWYKFERGERGLNMAQLLLLAQNLNMKVDDLIYGDKPRPKVIRMTRIQFDQ